MQDFSILIGGQAGDGIRQIGGLVAGLGQKLGVAGQLAVRSLLISPALRIG